MDFNWVALMVALLGGGGVFVAIREIVAVVTLAKNGVSGKEDRRKADIVAQRDFFQARAEAAERLAEEADRRYDDERDKRRIIEDELTLARRKMLENGMDPRPWPDTDDN